MLNNNRDRSLWRLAITYPMPTPANPAAVSVDNPMARSADDGAKVERVALEGIWHRYGNGDSSAWTLRGVDLSLRAGELMGLLGPSGCGKTTLLRLIAGFEQPHRGSIRIDGREVAGPGRFLEPERRGVGMVFQDYALFPHLDALANARFGLRRGQHPERVTWLFALLGLEGLERRYPHELSGGQRQRLALARALAPQPSVVLLDEPFSNLDAEVRERLRGELPAVLAACGACALLVTHDPQEALAISDRVAVLRDGVLEQCATPLELVRRPATAFVGRFVLQANLLPAQWCGQELTTPLGCFELPASAGEDRCFEAWQRAVHSPEGGLPLDAEGESAQICLQPGDLWLRPWQEQEPSGPTDARKEPTLVGEGQSVALGQAMAVDPVVAVGTVIEEGTPVDEHPFIEEDEAIEVSVLSREFLGRDWLYQVKLGDRRLRVRQRLSPALERGQRCRLALMPGAEPLLFPLGWPMRPRPAQSPRRA